MKTLRIGLLTAELNSGNMGCNALAYSAISLLQQVAERQGIIFQYVLFGGSMWVPEHYPEYADLSIQSCAPVVSNKEWVKSILKRQIGRIRRYRGLIMSCDLFFEIAGGDSFSDIYGIARPRAYNRVHRAIRKMGRPLVFLPQTIGPFKSADARKVAEDSLSIACQIFARDPISYQLATELSSAKKVTQTIDMAFFMGYEPREKNSGKLSIGINPSGLLWNGGYTGKNQFGVKDDYRGLLKTLIKSIDHARYEIELIPHVLSGPSYHVEDDYKVCRWLKEEFPHAVIAPFFYTPVEAKSYISGLDLLVGSRMHCCIAAYSSGVPIYPLAYSRKFKGLFKEELRYPYGADLVSDDRQGVVDGLCEVLKNLNPIQQEMPTRIQELDLYKTKLVSVLNNVISEPIQNPAGRS